MTKALVEQRAWFSDLSRDAKAVALAAERAPVTIERRDGDDLILMRKDVAEAERLGIALAAKIISAIATNPGGSHYDRLLPHFPWAQFLSDNGKNEFARELLAKANACASILEFEPLIAALAAWQSTAEAYAAGWNGDDYDWLPAEVLVTRPNEQDG